MATIYRVIDSTTSLFLRDDVSYDSATEEGILTDEIPYYGTYSYWDGTNWSDTRTQAEKDAQVVSGVPAYNVKTNADNIAKKAGQDTTYTKIEVNDIADDKVAIDDIYDGLDSTSADVPLSANQGNKLATRLTVVEDRQDVVLAQIGFNTAFDDTTDISIVAGSVSVSDNTLICEADGTTIYFVTTFTTTASYSENDVIYSQFKYTNDFEATSIDFFLDGWTTGTNQRMADINSPTSNTELIAYGIATVQSDFTGDLAIKLAPQGLSSGDTMTISKDSFINLNLTDIFGTGYEPSADLMKKAIDIVGYFDDTHTMTNKELAIAYSEYCKDLATAITELGGTI